MSSIFQECGWISSQIDCGNEEAARDGFIQLLDVMKRDEKGMTPLVNHIARRLGLFPYIDPQTATWQDRYVHEAFKADTGSGENQTLHLDQSLLLKRLVEGENLAVSAPTSFGKSFVIDAFLAIKKPANVVIIVPTIALMDEARRRITRKFSGEYTVITTAEAKLGEKNILIFPQERALKYLDLLGEVDLLIVDEFYKASSEFVSKQSSDRTSILLKVILEFSRIAKQRYFLAPNITELRESIFTKGMSFHEFRLRTVFLKMHEEYKLISGSPSAKKEQKEIALNSLLESNEDETQTKTLIYAGTYTEVGRVGNIIISQQGILYD